MKFLSILFLLIFNLNAANVFNITQKPKENLESIAQHAIKFGSGKESDVYIFVDPLCPYSRALVKKIDENKMLQLSSTYHILLHRLPRLDSEKTMQHIYESSNPKETLIDIMIYEDKVDLSNFKARQSTIDALSEIAEVAKTLDMSQRPYMIIFENGSKYCRVSEGEASCLEEFDSH